MDQSLIFTSMHGKQSIEVEGARTVNNCKCTCDTKPPIFAITVTASHEVLEPDLMFKGQPGEKIETCKFPNNPPLVSMSEDFMDGEVGDAEIS